MAVHSPGPVPARDGRETAAPARRAPIERQLALAFLAAAAIAAVVVAIHLHNATQLQERFRAVAETHETIGHLDDVIKEVLEAESGVRGYMITGDDGYLAAYRRALSQIDDHLHHLETSAAGTPRQVERVTQLARRVDRHFAFLTGVVDELHDGHRSTARQLLRIGAERAKVDGILEMAEAIGLDERQRLHERVAASREADRRANWTFVALGLMIAGVVASSYGAVRRQLLMRARADAEVAALNHSLSTLVAQLESFSSAVSHELRAPVHRIEGFAAILESTKGAQLDEEGRQLLARVRSNAGHMEALIDDLLAFCRSGRQPLALAPVDMAGVVRAVLDELAPAHPRAGVAVLDLPPALADRSLVTQVWRNLVGNAFKYSAKVAAPRIEIGGRRMGAEVEYWVRDNGAGFDMACGDRLFTPFSRLHSESQFPGNGVGLAIVRAIVDRHGGRIAAEGQVGAGAVFRFTLPAPERASRARRMRDALPARLESLLASRRGGAG